MQRGFINHDSLDQRAERDRNPRRRPIMHDAIFISDLHIGGSCNYSALLDFLRDNDARRWYLVGDIIDMWAISRSRKWPNEASLVIQKFLQKARRGEEIILLPGNHDAKLREFVNFEFGNIKIVDEVIHETGGKKYLVLHGDAFDLVIGHAEWMARIGSVAYDFLVSFNSFFNTVRQFFGLPFWSLSARIKKAVKHAVSYMSDFEKSLVEVAKQRKVDGIICGHIHTPAIKNIDEILYLNAGDWVESRTALIENNGNIDLVHY